MINSNLEAVIEHLQSLLDAYGNIPVMAKDSGGELQIIHNPEDDIYAGTDGIVYIIP